MASKTISTTRVLKGTFLTVLVWSLLGGAIGFAVAADESGTPTSIHIGERHVGDKGRYAVQVYEEQGDGWRPVLEDLPYIDFEWLAPRQIPDAEGRWVKANTLAVSDNRPDGEGGWDRWDFEYFVQPATWEVIAEESLWAGSQDFSSPPGDIQVGVPQQGGTMWRSSVLDWQRTHVLCGPLVPLAGPVLHLDAAIDLPSCVMGTFIEHDLDGDLAFHAEETVRQDGMEGVRLVSGGTFADRTIMELRAGLPYPTRIMQETRSDAPLELDDEQSVDASYRIEIRLERFAAGQGVPLAGEGRAGAAPAPQLDHTKRDPLGPDDAAAGLAFPFRDAYAHAAADAASGLPAFLSSHPGAYVAWTRYVEFDMQGNTSREWSFGVSDGTDTHPVHIRLVTESRTAMVEQLVPVPQDLLERDHRIEYGSWNGYDEDLRVPALDQLPSDMPTVASLIARAEAFTDRPFVAGPAVTWIAYCGDDACQMPVVRYHVGTDRFTQSSFAETAILNETADWWSVYVTFDHDGNPDSRSEAVSSTYRPAVATPATDPPQDNPASDQEAVVVLDGFWTLPGAPIIAGAGILATLTGLLYTLWPSMKGGIVGLFSRVRKDRLLDHPARADLMHCIETEPGIHFQALVRATGIGRGAVDHHLRKLAEAGLVIVHVGTGYHCYFPPGAVDRRVMTSAGALKSRGARDLVAAILSSPGISAGNAAAASGLTAGTVTHHAKRLAELGLVRVERVGRGVKLWPTEQTRAAARLA